MRYRCILTIIYVIYHVYYMLLQLLLALVLTEFLIDYLTLFFHLLIWDTYQHSISPKFNYLYFHH